MSDRKEYFRHYKARRKELAYRACKVCNEVSRRLYKVGCLECFARKQPRRKWDDLGKHIIEIYAGKDTVAYLQLRIYMETRQARTRGSIEQYRHTTGIKALKNQDGYTLAEIATITGRPMSTVEDRYIRGKFKTMGQGRRLLSYEDGDRLIQLLTGSPIKSERPSYSIDEAASVLGYDYDSIRKAVRRGLPSWYEGRAKRICKLTIDRAVAYLKETGKLRIHWRLLVNT